jgi:DNA invertase Pin-like site-specific DNA recombinase
MKKKPNKKPAIIYTRFSPRSDAETTESLDTQFELCTHYCKSQGMTVIGSYEDAAMSGANADNRPGLQNALDHAIRTKSFLVFYSLSRLARSVRDALEISDRVKGRAELCSVKETFDTSTPMGHLFYVMLTAFDEMEREKGAIQTSDSMQRHQRSGRRMTRKGKLPYGQRINPDDEARTLPDEYELKVIRTILYWREPEIDKETGEELRGLTYRDIANELTARGVVPRKTTKMIDGKKIEVDGKWHFGTIRNIIHRKEQDLFK